jgi:TP901 family phage tail tape measure protein
MADLTKTIEIIFGGVDRVSGAIDGITKNVSDGMGHLEGITDPLASAHDNVVKLEAALAALAVGGMALAIHTAGQFDSQFKEITTLIGDTGGGIDQFKEQIKEYANDSTQSIEDINGALYQAISLGVDYKDSLEALSTAEQLAVAGKANLTASTELLLGTLNAYGDGVDQATRYSDAFFTIVQDGKTTIPELAQYLSQVSNTAAAAEVPIETLGAAIAAVTASGAPTSQAMTQIRQVIEALIKPTKQASDYAKELGLDFSAQALAADGLEGVMQKVFHVTGGNVDQMAKLFTSSEALRAALILSRDESGKFAGALEDMANKTGATATAYDKMAGDINHINTNLKNNWENTLAEIGENLLANYGNIVGSIVQIFQAIQDSVKAGAFKDVFAVVTDLSKDIEETFSTLAKNLPEALKTVDFSEFTKSIQDLAKETSGIFEAFFGDVDLSTPEGLGRAIQTLVDLGTRLNEVATGMAQAWQPVAEWLGKAAESASDMDSKTTELIGNIFGAGKIVNEFTGFLGGLGNATTALSGLFSIMAGQRLVALAQSLGVTKAAVGTAAGTGLVGAFGLLGAVIGGVALVEGTKKLTDWLHKLVSDTPGAVKVTGDLVEAVREYGMLTGNPELLAGIKEIPIEVANAVRELAWLNDKITDLPATQQMEIRSIFLEDGLVAATQKILEFENLDPKTEVEVLTTDALKVINDYWQVLDQIPPEMRTKIEALLAEGNEKTAQSLIDMFPEKQTVEIAAEEDPEARRNVETFGDYIIETLEDGSIVIVEAKPDMPSVDDTAKKIKDELDPIKVLDIEAKVDIAKIQAASDMFSALMSTINTEIEWSARIDIAQIEADAQKVEAAFESIGGSVMAVTETVGTMFSDLANLGGGIHFYELYDLLEKEMNMQSDLIDAQIRLIDKQVETMDRGDAIFTISGQNVSDGARAFMMDVLKEIQVEISGSQGSYLMGQ